MASLFDLILEFSIGRIPCQTRELEPNPPFVEWTAAYATGHWNSDALLGIGLAIGNWLDAQQQWLTQLARSPAPVTLVIETAKDPDAIEQAALEAPWELIARIVAEPTNSSFAPEQGVQPPPAPLDALLARLGPVDWQYVRHMAFEPSIRLSVVRRLGPATQALEPSKFRLSAVFMPCQPEGAADLSADVQEAAIRKASRGIGMDLEVEDSGTLDGLDEMIARLGRFDVIQVSCPAAMPPRAALALEGPRGELSDATAALIWKRIVQKPGLLIVSAHTWAAASANAGDSAQNASMVAVGSQVLGPLSIELCQGGWPAVLGLPAVTAEQGGVELAAALYRLLAQGGSLLDALARARVAVVGTAWHRARLLLGPGGGGRLVDSADARPTRPDFIQDQQFLDPEKNVRIAGDYQASLHRRAFQRVVATLRDATSPGIVVYSADKQLRATFVSRVLQRLQRELRRVVITGDFDAGAIMRAIQKTEANPHGRRRAREAIPRPATGRSPGA